MILKTTRLEAGRTRVNNAGSFTEIQSCEKRLAGNFFPIREPLTVAAPVRSRSLAKIAMLASPKVYEGFAWHNTIYELSPTNFASILDLTKSDYMLVESCLYDSRRAWALLPLQKEKYAEWMRKLTDRANKNGIPSVFWYTMGFEMVHFFSSAVATFDVVGCADERSADALEKLGIKVQYLSLAFSPEQFNPLRGYLAQNDRRGLIFNGLSRLIRFNNLHNVVEPFLDTDISIIETRNFVSYAVLANAKEKYTDGKLFGLVSDTRIQDLYKNSRALLATGESGTDHLDILESAACRCPVLYAGSSLPAFLKGSVDMVASPHVLRERYGNMVMNPLEREKAGHLAWRHAHLHHTFAHRMDLIHSWLGLKKQAVSTEKATIITPSCRPENAIRAYEQYAAQTWENKEFIYVFNGSSEKMPNLPSRPDIQILCIPDEYSTGTVMNAGIEAASGAYCFKFDDDDFYGANYVLDRMIYFREFDLATQGIGAVLLNFEDEKEISQYKHNKKMLVAQPIGKYLAGWSKFAGATAAFRTDLAHHVNYAEHSFGAADDVFYTRNAYFMPGAASLNTDVFNFCVYRSNTGNHIWQVSRESLEDENRMKFRMKDIFI